VDAEAAEFLGSVDCSYTGLLLYMLGKFQPSAALRKDSNRFNTRPA